MSGIPLPAAAVAPPAHKLCPPNSADRKPNSSRLSSSNSFNCEYVSHPDPRRFCPIGPAMGQKRYNWLEKYMPPLLMYSSNMATGQVSDPVLVITTSLPCLSWSVLLLGILMVTQVGLICRTHGLILATSSYLRKPANASKHTVASQILARLLLSFLQWPGASPLKRGFSVQVSPEFS